MKKFIFFTNIPTPYRTSFYNELHKNRFDFEVFYMRLTEADRNWNIDLSELKHPYYIDHSFYTMIGRFHVHFNPRIIWKLLCSKGAEIIIGGSWNDIDVLLLLALKRLGIFKNQIHFWSEANYLTIGASRDNLLKRVIRKLVYHSSTGAQITSGKMTEITLVEKWGINCNGFVPLPNTIEEEKYLIINSEVETRYRNPVPVFLMPVRLLENVKGIINFFTSIGTDNVRRGVFLVAGDGPDKEMIQRFISAHDLDEHIKLVGHCDTETMVSLYKKANVFVLPSFSDPSPLTLVEALSMRLPVLVSERCGNHFEAVVPGENGYLFNPLDPGSVRRAFEELLLRFDNWRQMGERSALLYRKTFDKKSVIENFIQGMNGFSGRNSGRRASLP